MSTTTVIRCDNESEALRLMEILHERGFTWSHEEPCLGRPEWSYEPQCYWIYEGLAKQLTYSSMSYAIEDCGTEPLSLDAWLNPPPSTGDMVSMLSKQLEALL